jgi:hypothetical protein
VRAAIRWRNAKQAPGNKSRGKVEISPAGRPRPVGRATLEVRAWPTGQEEAAPRIALHARVAAPAEPIASAIGIFRAVAQETVVPSAAVPRDSTDPQPAATAAVAEASIVAEDPAAGASVVAEARGVVAAGAAEAVVAVAADEGAAVAREAPRIEG